MHHFTGLSPPTKYFTDGSKAVLLLWIFIFFCLAFAMPLYVSVYICLVSPAGKGLTSWLSFVVSYCEFLLTHWYPWSGVVLDCIDPGLCTLTYFDSMCVRRESKRAFNQTSLDNMCVRRESKRA